MPLQCSQGPQEACRQDDTAEEVDLSLELWSPSEDPLLSKMKREVRVAC